MSLKLSKEFGVSPTVSVCIICGEDKNEIALLGSNYKNKSGKVIQAPSKMVTSIEPCDNCREKYLSQGVMLVEADQDYNGNPAPTGNFLVVKNEAFKNIFTVDIPAKKICYIDTETFSKFS